MYKRIMKDEIDIVFDIGSFSFDGRELRLNCEGDGMTFIIIFLEPIIIIIQDENNVKRLWAGKDRLLCGVYSDSNSELRTTLSDLSYPTHSPPRDIDYFVVGMNTIVNVLTDEGPRFELVG